ncbi:type II toxin-antitoxin system HicA family toxin [Pseudomonas aeruginosa]|uniref:type II toxin-antitoxin system HicA family toxin n=1 Tax=Pseudomonas aeruginosa TaxID=287 RepID=UPI00293554B4|nr:type II toxin-antitoxin system HicA family toxin [Pseudomonas aeruginosa]MDV2731232.1 type II toxin-antitoxin system HicA family toxin [Pseudomonas aeruginosa]
MANARELARGREQLRGLIDFALSEGWQVRRTSNGHLKFSKPGHIAIYTGTTASDHRSCLNAQAELRRAMRRAEQGRHRDVKREVDHG